MYELLEESYLEWLCRQVKVPLRGRPSRTYWSLLKQLQSKQFVWFVPNDDNRIEDGKELRYEFLEATGNDAPHGWHDVECSMLELIVGISRRLAFEDNRDPSDWFWDLLRNLGISHMTDEAYSNPEDIEEILEAVIWRNYQADGTGGLFPLKNPTRDQREVELWYQMSSYLIEQI